MLFYTVYYIFSLLYSVRVTCSKEQFQQTVPALNWTQVSNIRFTPYFTVKSDEFKTLLLHSQIAISKTTVSKQADMTGELLAGSFSRRRLVATW